jgi:hypothetical protein
MNIARDWYQTICGFRYRCAFSLLEGETASGIVRKRAAAG